MAQCFFETNATVYMQAMNTEFIFIANFSCDILHAV